MLLRIAVCACLVLASNFCWADVFDVFIASGQSNMDGRGQTSQLIGTLASFVPPQPDVLIHYTNPGTGNVGERPTYQAGWDSLAPGYAVPPSGFSGTLPSGLFGPEVSFGKSMDEGTTGRRVAIIKVSRGNTNLASHWDPSDGGANNGDKGYMYEGFETAVPAAIQALQAMGHSVEIRGMIWHQGEADGGPSLSLQYEANLTEFIQVVRQDLGYPNLPFLIGELESISDGRKNMRDIQAAVATAMDFVELVPSTGLAVSDGTHFTTADVIELGNRFAQSMLTSISTLQGDFNRDGIVDMQDFQVWQAFEGSTLDARADANNDGVVDGLDYAIWYAAVPEPSADLLAVIAVVGCSLFSWSRRRRLQGALLPIKSAHGANHSNPRRSN